jgi:hypothetical protein
MKADGDVIPAPRTFEQLRHDPEFVEDSADAIVTMVTPRPDQRLARGASESMAIAMVA